MSENCLRLFIAILQWIFYVAYITHKIKNNLKITWKHLKSLQLLQT